MPRAERHIPFFHLLDAARKPGCTLCRLIATDTRRYLESVLYGSVNDVGFRDEWRAARGYCHRHAWVLAEFGDALGISILYEDLVNTYGPDLLRSACGSACLLCANEKRDLLSWLRQIERDWTDDELRAALTVGDGLCGPHLRLAQRELRNREVRVGLRSASERALVKLSAELRALIQSFDYQHEPPKDERIKRAWRRAIENLVGLREISVPER
jgi:hypothetical protein